MVNRFEKITFLEKLPQKLVEIFFLIAKFFGKINFLCSLSNKIGKSILENSRVRIFVRFPLPQRFWQSMKYDHGKTYNLGVNGLSNIFVELKLQVLVTGLVTFVGNGDLKDFKNSCSIKRYQTVFTTSRYPIQASQSLWDKKQGVQGPFFLPIGTFFLAHRDLFYAHRVHFLTKIKYERKLLKRINS